MTIRKFAYAGLLLFVSISGNAQLLPTHQAYTATIHSYDGRELYDASSSQAIASDKPADEVIPQVGLPQPTLVATIPASPELSEAITSELSTLRPTESKVINTDLATPFLGTENLTGRPFFGPVSKYACTIALDAHGRCHDRDKLANWLSFVNIAAHTSDYLTTRYAIAQGAREANPVLAWPLAHEPLGSSIKFGFAYFQAWALKRLLTDPKPEVRKTAKLQAYFVTAINVGMLAWVSWHNMGVAGQMRNQSAAR
jgi:hypothetical protein